MALDEANKLIDVPGQLLDTVVEILTKVGVELPALVLQLFLLLLVLVALGVALRSLRRAGGDAKPAQWFAAAAIALIAAGIVFGIVSQALLPNRLVGRVSAPNLHGVTAELLDFRGQPVSMSGTVDTRSGEFIAYYRPTWYGRARTLRITAPTCKPRDYVLSRGRLWTESTWEFACDKV